MAVWDVTQVKSYAHVNTSAQGTFGLNEDLLQSRRSIFDQEQNKKHWNRREGRALARKDSFEWRGRMLDAQVLESPRSDYLKSFTSLPLDATWPAVKLEMLHAWKHATCATLVVPVGI